VCMCMCVRVCLEGPLCDTGVCFNVSVCVVVFLLLNVMNMILKEQWTV